MFYTKLECGGHKGGWTTIVKFDISKGDSYPSGWTRITTPGDFPKVVCRSGNDAGGRYKSINDYNIDGLSIALGNPRKHIHVWLYAIGISDDYNYPVCNSL